MAEILFSSWGGEVVDNRSKEPQEYETASKVSLPEYFQQNEEIKALIGWYGIVLRTSEVNIVDLCRSYMEAIQEKSCGKCFLCRIGTKVIADTLGRMCRGKGRQADLEILARLAESISESSKCNIGQSGPLPLRHALEYFADDFALAANGGAAIPAGTYR
ncbi:MAG: dihydropyrimidine dehydrogenase subunit A, partial [Deltaproteobacteria bacterium]|nr:dihydropyrimidine dehydrogenase subunit A [Candidatus Tharpellaceae bacterium]